MIPLEDARSLVFRSVGRLDVVTLSITDAAASGLVLADDVTAAEDVPPFPNTAVDGYALRAADTAVVPAELDVVGELAAGAAPTVRVIPGGAVRIMTGAPVPEGADAIVMVEDTERLDDGRRVRGLPADPQRARSAWDEHRAVRMTRRERSDMQSRRMHLPR